LALLCETSKSLILRRGHPTALGRQQLANVVQIYWHNVADCLKSHIELCSGPEKVPVEFNFGNSCRERFCRAVHELSEVLALCSRASKAVQKQCVADTISAIGLCDWSELQARALAKLVGSIEQHLPKAKPSSQSQESCRQAFAEPHRLVARPSAGEPSALVRLPWLSRIASCSP
jgi:hypothetical protein